MRPSIDPPSRPGLDLLALHLPPGLVWTHWPTGPPSRPGLDDRPTNPLSRSGLDSGSSTQSSERLNNGAPPQSSST